MHSTMGIISVLGAPGAGKGTLCNKLAEDYGLRHISVGDLLRRVASSPDADETVLDYVRRGELLPTKVLFAILKAEVESPGSHPRPRPVLLLDGFPRQLDQAKQFEEVFGEPDLVLFFDCPEHLAEERVVHRMTGRAGDNRETFRKRHREFLDLNPPIVRYYEDKKKIVTIDTSGNTGASYENLTIALNNKAEWVALTAVHE